MEFEPTKNLREGDAVLLALGTECALEQGGRIIDGMLIKGIQMNKPIEIKKYNGEKCSINGVVTGIEQTDSSHFTISMSHGDDIQMALAYKAPKDVLNADPVEIMTPGLRVTLVKVGPDGEDFSEAEIQHAVLGDRFIFTPKGKPPVRASAIMSFKHISDYWIEITTFSGSLYRVHIDRDTNREAFDALVQKQTEGSRGSMFSLFKNKKK